MLKTVPVLSGSPTHRAGVGHVDEMRADPLQLRTRFDVPHDNVRLDLGNTPTAVRFQLDNASRASLGAPELLGTAQAPTQTYAATAGGLNM